MFRLIAGHRCLHVVRPGSSTFGSAVEALELETRPDGHAPLPPAWARRGHAAALEAAYSAVRLEPLRESAHRTVVCVHLAEGNVVEALRPYDTFRALLEKELGVAPAEQMARLVGDPLRRG